MDGTTSTFTFTAPRLGTLWASARRFPFVSAAAIAFALLMMAGNHNFIDDDLVTPAAYGLFAAFFATLAIGLVAEAQKWPRERLWLGSALALVMVGLWVYGLGGDIGLPHVLLGFSLLGLCMIAPHFGGARDEELWVFNQQSFYGLGIGGISALVFHLGIGAVLWAFSQLFGSHGDKLWIDTTFLIYAVFLPLYSMTFIPRLPLKLEGTPGYPAALSFLLTLVALPVLLLFGAVVAVYGVQILFLGRQPVGSVSWMVMAFAAAGMALHFLLYPLRDMGGKLVRFFYHYFYFMLVPLLGLLFWAVSVRVYAYGVTEYRYLAILGGFWAALMCLLWLVRGHFKIWHPPAILAVLLLFASFGPWGAEGVAYYAQSKRLSSVLTELGLLENDVLIPHKVENTTWQQRRDLSSLLDYFNNRRDRRMAELLAGLRNLGPASGESEFSGWPQALMSRWGMAYVDSYHQREDGEAVAERVRYQAGSIFQNRGPIKVVGYDYLLPYQVYQNSSPMGWLDLKVKLLLEGDALIIQQDGKMLGQLAVLPLLKDPLQSPQSFINGPALEADIQLARGRAHLTIESVELERKDGSWQPLNVSGQLYWKAP